MKVICSIIGAISVLAVASPAAHAADAAKIKLSDFDLSTQKGVEKLYKRISSDARQLCSPMLYRVSSSPTKYRLCVEDTIALAISRSGLEPLAAFQAAKTEQPIKSEKPLRVTVAD